MRVKPILFGIVVVIVFMSVVVISQAAGYWSTSGKVTTSGELVNPSADDVETIKGWMTLNQISDTYAVPLSEILREFSLPDTTSGDTAIKDLESETFEVTLLREWLVSRMNGEKTSFDNPVTNGAIPTKYCNANQCNNHQRYSSGNRGNNRNSYRSRKYDNRKDNFPGTD